MNPTTTGTATIPALEPTQSASSLLTSSRHAPRLSSGCNAIDELLTPTSSSRLGLAQGSVLEIMGPSGIGKTRMALGFVMANRFDAVGEGTDADVLVIGQFGWPLPTLSFSAGSELKFLGGV